jgi:hypothetical protein
MHAHVKEFLRKYQLTEKEMPNAYPFLGVFNFYGLNEQASYFKIAEVLSYRIKELSDLPTLPRLATATDFNALASFFAPREVNAGEEVAKGPLGTNVVYAVASRDLVAGQATAVVYGERPEDWKPFLDKPNRTIGLLTQNALSDAGQDAAQYRVIALSQELVPKLKQARNDNSLVLIVLDQASLTIEPVKKHLAEYDNYDGPHIGLITAGGDPNAEPLLSQVFAAKCIRSEIWGQSVQPFVDSATFERHV